MFAIWQTSCVQHMKEKIRNAEQYFSKLPSEKTREYEKKIASFAEQMTTKDGIDALKQMIEGSSEYAFEAFFCLSIIYRRSKDFELMRDLIYKHPQFKKRISFNHIVIQYLVHSETFYDYDELLSMAYRDAQMFDKNAGYLQAFCNAFITICEQCDEESKKRITGEWYDSALESINQAIQLDPDYAKFYDTKARIIGLKERYSEAERLLNQAISKENSTRPDYAITLQTYQSHKMNLALQKLKNQYESRLISLEHQIESLKKSVNMLPGSAAFIMEQKMNGEESVYYPEAYKGNGPYAFISYAHRDKDEVYEIIRMLQYFGVNTWFDEGIQAGAEWPEEIGNHLLGSKMVVVMLSTNSLQSANVRREVNLALSENRRVIVALLDDVAMSPGMKLQFGLYQMISKKNYDINEFANKLGSAIRKEFLGGEC